ncbi:MAG: NADP-dependent oxidoreductase [Planctomycetota bacterium]|nr:NADP-dependent oxidoreductase [Planctomycetota bacterium]
MSTSAPSILRRVVRGAAVLAVSMSGAARAEAPATMSAVRMHEFGPPSVMRVEEVPTPRPAAGEILVRVRAAGVNPVDWKVRSGQIRQFASTLPYTPGYDICGVVESVGEGVTAFAPGDEVMAYMALTRGGGYAQYAVLPATEAAKKPASMEHAAAAGLPLAGLTAWQALVDTAKLDKGQTVLIHGAAGGVGHLAVQIARSRGARVIATASERNLEFVRSLGADVVVDYRAQKFEEVASDVDVVLDTVGGETGERSIGVLKPGGIIVSIVGMPDQARCKERGVRGTAILVRPDGRQLAALGALADEGALRCEVGATMPLAEAARAHELSEGGKTPRGKIVLTVD